MEQKTARYLDTLDTVTRDIGRLPSARGLPRLIAERLSQVLGDTLQYAFVDRSSGKIHQSDHLDREMKELLDSFLDDRFVQEMQKLDWSVIDTRGVRFLVREVFGKERELEGEFLIIPDREQDTITSFSVLWGGPVLSRIDQEEVLLVSTLCRIARMQLRMLGGTQGGDHDLRRKALELKEIAGLGADLVSLGKEDFFGTLLLHAMGRAMSKTAVLFLSTNENNTEYAPVASRGVLKKMVENIRITGQTTYARELKKKLGPVVIADIAPGLDQEERDELLRMEAAVLFPMIAKTGVVGILSLGERMNGKPYTEKVIDSIRTLCNQMVMAVENSKLSDLRYAFSRYVSHQLADSILSAPDEIKLGGEYRKVTVLFADIRGFTNMAEKMQPEEVVDLLNTYLSGLTEVVFRYEGTLDKYMGDCLMAVFGAPVSHYNDSERAAVAAIDMLRFVEGINQERKKEGKPRVDIGIGINTGHVISGNMGSLDRMDYTVIGDVVNTAARLEDIAGKGQILISRETYEEIRYVVDARFVDSITVKGREQTVDVYEVKDLIAGRFINVLNRVDPYKVGHYLNIARDAELIGQDLGMEPEELIKLRSAIMLIDIGRIGLNEAVFNKKDKLTPEEYEVIKSHVLRGAEYVKAKLHLHEEGVNLVKYHHEAWDGSGYPDGLKGEQIPLWARIVNIVDSYHALISKRPFREPYPEEEAMDILARGRGVKFDPRIVDIYLNILRRRVAASTVKV
jgi:HD-GYP domain-containing protein (c-di-GMP phosphodiesterase class II)